MDSLTSSTNHPINVKPSNQRSKPYPKRLLIASLTIPVLTTTMLLGTATAAHAENWLSSRLRSLFGDQVEGQANGRGGGGAVRGETCNAFNQIRPDAPVEDNLIALMPQSREGATIARYPTFWFYLPLDESSEAIRAEFWLQDQEGNSVLEEDLKLQLPKQPGVFSVTVPTSEVPLEVNEQYQWFFIVVCDELDYSINPHVQGWVKRIEPEAIVQQLGGAIDAPPENLLSIYTDYSLWYETVSLLVNHRETQPELWTGLLDLFELTRAEPELTVAPLIPLED